MGDHYDFRGMCELLRRLVSEGQSGTLYIRTDEARAGMVSLRDGVITDVLYQSRHGYAALQLMRRISRGTCRFDRNAPIVASEACPPTGDLLRFLDRAPETDLDSPAEPESADPALENLPMQSFLADVEQCLQDYIGPIASVVMEQALEETGPLDGPEQAESLIDRLKEEIAEEAEAARFVSVACESLRKVQAA